MRSADHSPENPATAPVEIDGMVSYISMSDTRKYRYPKPFDNLAEARK